jgi:hypothetical protein
MVPWVPTGKKAGVEKKPWSVSILPSRAFERGSFLVSSNLKAIVKIGLLEKWNSGMTGNCQVEVENF